MGGKDMDATTFEKMYAECYSAVKRLCYFKLPSENDADDILQEVALTAWTRRESVKSVETFKPWLLQIARNKIIDFYRRRAKGITQLLDDINEINEAKEIFVVDSYPLEESIQELVELTLGKLENPVQQILTLAYLQHVPQAEIARKLGIPLGTVKSRLHSARRQFKKAYPHTQDRITKLKGDDGMKELPEFLPYYKIETTDKPLFECKWEEANGYGIVPKLGEKYYGAVYEIPERKMSKTFPVLKASVTGKAIVHGVEGVEIFVENTPVGMENRIVVQLTDSRFRFLSTSFIRDDVRHNLTFLDGDDFLEGWGEGEDNCGRDINIKRKGFITRTGSKIECPDVMNENFDNQGYKEKLKRKNVYVYDVVDSCTVTLDKKVYETIRVMMITNNDDIAMEIYLDRNGRTVLSRRFNHDNWMTDKNEQRWSEKLPDNERIIINGKLYVHWLDSISNYICG